MALHGGGHLEFKKMHKGDFWGLFGIRFERCPGVIPEKNQLSAILLQVPVFFSLMLLHYRYRLIFLPQTASDACTRMAHRYENFALLFMS